MQSLVNSCGRLLLLAALFALARGGAASAVTGGLNLSNCRIAAEYSARCKGVSIIVAQNGKIVFEDYPNGGAAGSAHELASGTKSFAGIAAIAAKEDGLLDLDEKVCLTITEWQRDPKRSQITIRQLLTLTSGLDTSVGFGPPPSYAEALKSSVSDPTFKYGPAPFQVFGELMRRKLSGRNENMVGYIERRVLSPAGIAVSRWRNGSDGQPLIPQGAQLTARNWEKLGELILNNGSVGGRRLLDEADVRTLLQGTPQNPMYGLTWWLNRPIGEELRRNIRQLTMSSDLRFGTPGVPDDLVMAAGAGKQRLYVVPSQHLVVVRQASGIAEALLRGDSTGFSDTEFWQLLTQGKSNVKAGKPAVETARTNPSSTDERRERLRRLLDRDRDGRISGSERQTARELIKRRLREGRQESPR